MANINETSFATAVKTQYEKRLLIRAIPRLIHGRWARRATLNKFGAHEIRRYESLSAVTTALSESNTPAENAAPTISTVTLTPLWYGAWVGYGDEIEMTAFDPIVSETTSILGEQAGLSADTLIRNTITAGASKLYSGEQTARTDLNHPVHEIAYDDLVDAMSTIMAANAFPVSGGYFVCVIHPHTLASLRKDPTFVNTFVQEAGGDSPMRTGYIGKFLNCFFFMSSNAREYVDGGVGTDDVYSMLFIGGESFATTGFGNLLPKNVDGAGPEDYTMTGKQVNPVQIIPKQLGSAGADDPLNQRASLGWKFTLATSILNSAFIYDLEHINSFSAS